MKILVFDTCLDKMYVTLAQDEKILTSRIVTNQGNKYHSAFLISTIKEVLRENNLTPQDIDALGTNIGPGSFTGIRACTTVARMLAQQLNIKAVGVSSLEILAELNTENKPTIVALDARKNCAYLYKDNEIKGAVQIEEIKQILEKDSYTLITDDKLQPILGGKSYQQQEYPLGEILAGLTFKKLQSEETKWQNLKPLYIQPPGVGGNIAHLIK
ncbi:MAG: tRNA (adenosine(37)-N6)-threonylcarbamoyltransferase complex dimerization subunit type 1 TsaB [Muribaculaceae bacterium]|nr:tRNA (adenosine(37)-N6)-threonylcarbamoyltransferase complex dimerization subunit type 1 TsaB [Muribaculaceae bacterium]